MKKLFLLLALVGVLGVGCSDKEDDSVNTQSPAENPEDGTNEENPDNTTKPNKDYIFVNDGEECYIVEAKGGEIYCSIATDIEYNINIPEDAQSWLSVADTRAELRLDRLTFIVAKNEIAEDRSAEVEFVNTNGDVLHSISFIQKRKVVISQGANNEIWYTTSDNTKLFPNSIEPKLFGAILVSNIYKNGQGVLTFDDDITVIGSSAFYGCSTLTAISIPDSVTTIGGYTFYGCSSLTSITIPDSVTTIGDSTFYACSSLTSITIPDGVTTIGDSTFYGCSSLTSITIPDSVTTIGDSTFYGCSSLTSITIPDGVTTIGDSTFYGCSSLTSVTIPDGVTTIGDSTFYGCSSLTSVTIPDGVTEIGYQAFYGCTGELIVNCNIPDAYYDYYNYYGVFYGSKFTSVTIGDSVTSIGDRAFYDCSSLTSVYITDLPAWCKIDFGDDSANPLCYAKNLYLNNELVTDLVIPSDITEIKSYAFLSCNSLTSVTIPDGVTEIGYQAFYGCSSLTSITIPDSVTTIGKYAFYGCTGELTVNCNIPDAYSEGYNYYGVFYGSKFTSVTIGDSVTSIGTDAFAYCRSLTSVTIPDSVTTIGEYAFYGCSSLTSVTIGDSVTTIGNYAFYDCRSLTSVYCKATTPPEGGTDMFYKNASGRKIYVPTESVEAYKSATYWRDYADAIEGYNF